MTVAPPPQRLTRPPARGRVVETRPLRHPEADSPAFMGARAWWLVAMNVLVPGSAQVLAGNRRLGRLGLGATLLGWVLVVAALVTALVWRGVFITLMSNWFVLTFLQVLLIGYLILWIVLTFDTLRLVRLVKLPPLRRLLVPVVALLVLGLVGSGAAYAASAVGAGRGALELVFGNSGPSLPPSDGYYNVLLLGADSGEGRDSMRFDSISVVSVNAETGAVTITGIPRDMPDFPFAEGPMRDLYPEGHRGHRDSLCGWGSGINQLRTEVDLCRNQYNGENLYPNAAMVGSTAGVEATKDAAEGILGIEIPYYVFIDMHGFAELIDALGGVEITVEKRLPKGGGPGPRNLPVEEWAIGWIEEGTQRMDGDTAQWYARSRYTTSDWDRMKRQRELQIAILEQFTPQNVLLRFNQVVEAGSAMVQTDLPKDKLSEFFDLMLLAKELPVTTIELTPEGGVSDTDPDYEYVRALVHEALHPPTPEPEAPAG